MKKIAAFAFIFTIIISSYVFSFAQNAAAVPPGSDAKYDKALVGMMAIQALGKIGAPEARDLLIRALNNNNFFIRGYAAQALGRIGDKGVITVLENAAKEDSYYMVRVYATISLLQLGAPGAEQKFLDLLNDKNPSVRANAVGELNELAPRFLTELFKLYSPEKDNDVKERLLRQFGACKYQPAADIARQALESDNNRVRQAACYAAASILDKKEAIPLLKKRLEDNDVMVRAEAKVNLGKLKEISLIDLFSKDMEDRDEQLRASSFVALAYLEDMDIIPALLKTVVDPQVSTFLRDQATSALIILRPNVKGIFDELITKTKFKGVISSGNLEFNFKINGKRLALVFIDALKDPKDPLHRDAAVILRTISDPLSLPALREALFERNSDVAGASALTLGDLHDKGAVAGLMKLCGETL